MTDVLTNAELNRATLARQLLLERAQLTPSELVEKLLGFQSQTTRSWYVGLWARLTEFDPVALGEQLERCELVRLPTMRSTIHLHTPADALALRPWTHAALDRELRGQWKGELPPKRSLAAATRVVRKAVDERPRLGRDLGELLAKRFPDQPPLSLTIAARALVPMVQVPPRGVWGKSGQPLLAALESWVGAELREPEPATLVLRYLSAFGPATVRDAQRFAGVTRLRPVFDELGPRLAVFESEDGRELFDLPDAPRPPAKTKAPPRLLYDFDNVLLGYDDRSRIVTEQWAKRFADRDGGQPQPVLLDGMTAGEWRAEVARGKASLRVELWAAPPRGDAKRLEREANALLAFLAPKADVRKVEIVGA